VSASLISKVTDSVWETVQAWQTRPLEALYPIVYLDGLVIKIRQDNRVINQTVHVALGVNLDGHKEVLGLWLAERMMPPKVWYFRMTQEAAGVDRMPPQPTMTLPKPLAAAIFKMICSASRL